MRLNAFTAGLVCLALAGFGCASSSTMSLSDGDFQKNEMKEPAPEPSPQVRQASSQMQEAGRAFEEALSTAEPDAAPPRPNAVPEQPGETDSNQEQIEDLEQEILGLRTQQQSLIDCLTRLKKQQEEYIEKAFDAAYTAAASIETAYTSIQTAEGLTNLELQYNMSFNVWSDHDVRGTWDNVRDVGVVVGLGVAVASFALDDSETMGGDEWAAGGGGVAALAIGIDAAVEAFGSDDASKNATKLQRKLLLFEQTRNAYDRLKMREAMLGEWRKLNDKRRAEFSQFRERLEDKKANGTIEEKAELLDEFAQHYETFQLTLNQLPTYIQEVQTSVKMIEDSAAQFAELDIASPVDTSKIKKKTQQAQEDIEELTVTVVRWTQVIRQGTQWANAAPNVSHCGASIQLAGDDRPN